MELSCIGIILSTNRKMIDHGCYFRRTSSFLIALLYMILSCIFPELQSFAPLYNSGRLISLAREPMNHQSKLSMSSPRDDSIMSFGDKMDIVVRLPTRDQLTVQDFLEKTNFIVESTWERGTFKLISDGNFLLQFASIPIPGIDVINPEMEVNFVNTNGTIYMTSGNWTLRGMSGGILKDSRFMQSFDVKLSGRLSIDVDKTSKDLNQQVVTSGWVDYRVQGSKPTVFRSAPAFILDNTIAFIQACVENFAVRQFSQQLINTYKRYAKTLVK